MKLSALLAGIAAGQVVTTAETADERRKSSSKGNGYAYGYGDPHFSIAPPTALPLCFDIHPHENVAQLNFLIDPVSSLQVTGKTEPAAEHPGKTFITEITISSPEGIRIKFGRDGVTQINADGSTKQLEGRGAVGDVNYVVMFYSQEECVQTTEYYN